MVFHSTRTVCNKQQTQKQLKQLLASFALFLLGVSFLSIAVSKNWTEPFANMRIVTS